MINDGRLLDECRRDYNQGLGIYAHAYPLPRWVLTVEVEINKAPKHVSLAHLHAALRQL